MGDWTFFSNYGHVLVCLARNREARLREVAAEVGITERAVQKIVRDMQDAGVITVSKQGRCNRYRINRRKSLRHPLESHCSVGKLLSLVVRPAPGQTAAEDSPEAAIAEAEPKAARPKAADSRPATSDAPASAERPTETEGKAKKPKHAGVDVRQQGSLF
jgi:predicted ArsR family transcriptional regulator